MVEDVLSKVCSLRPSRATATGIEPDVAFGLTDVRPLSLSSDIRRP